MRALVIYRVNISEDFNYGVSLKMQGQCYGLMLNGYEVDTMYLNEKGVMFNNLLLKSSEPGGLQEVLLKYKGFYKEVGKQIAKEHYDLVLIRFTSLIPSFIRMLIAINKNDGTKVIIDLPTYPYAKEMEGIKGKVLLSIDQKNQQRLSGLVDLIIHYGLEKELFGIRCVNLSNGIIPVQKQSQQNMKREDDLQIIAVGKWSYWHGLDRVIDGMDGSEGFTLHVVGEGRALQTLQHKSEGKANIKFHGSLVGKPLEALYSKARLAIGTLGIQRKGVELDSSLKHREYCLRGIPFILGSQDLDFPEHLGFVKYFPGDEVISSQHITTFIEKVKVERKEIIKYALKELGWDKKMKKVLDEV